MRTVEEWRQAGYVVRLAEHEFDCTEVLSDYPFRYYNGLHHHTMQAVMDNASEAARTASGGYRLLTAGLFKDDEAFPLVLLDEALVQRLDKLYARFTKAQKEAAEASEAFFLELTAVGVG